jgi:hypothetical protein
VLLLRTNLGINSAYDSWYACDGVDCVLLHAFSLFWRALCASLAFGILTGGQRSFCSAAALGRAPPRSPLPDPVFRCSPSALRPNSQRHPPWQLWRPHPRQHSVLRHARVFHAERMLAQLAAERKEEGSEPSTQALREHLTILRGQQQRCVETSDAMPRAWQHRQAFAQWASRWKRWGGRVGVLRVRDHAPKMFAGGRPAGLARGSQLRSSSVIGNSFWYDFGFGFGHHLWGPFL